MKIPIEWLKEYIEIKANPQELSERLTISGTEIEGLSHKSFERVIVGEIINIKKHPQVDDLQVADVDIDSKVITVVCGAKNIEKGQKVPVALPGAKLGEQEITKRKIYGVVSEGMLCSEANLSLSDNHSGIMILDPRVKIGTNLTSILNVPDLILEAELTPNRGDLLSILGIARELKALYNLSLKEPEINFSEDSFLKTKDFLQVEVKDFILCPRYIAKIIEVPEINESPLWLQNRLASCGIRPINAVVDITNYVMLEMGQPLHAFDGEKIIGKKIIVRRAKNNEVIETLDGIKRILNKENLVIADKRKPIALAGVMGGINSEVDLKSKIIVLEAANFDKTNIRRTGNKYALRTEAVLRFEKGLPFELPEVALKRACYLLQKICQAKIYQGTIDLYQKRSTTKIIKINYPKIKEFLGVEIKPRKIEEILTSLGFKLIKKEKDFYSFQTPWWRTDISIWQDLTEEIARIYGYNKIPSNINHSPILNFNNNYSIRWINQLKNTLTSLGFYEIYSYSLIGQDLYKKINCQLQERQFIKIKNPLSSDQEYLRPSLIPNLLEIVSKNSTNYESFKIYEVSKVYSKNDNKFLEERLISGILSEQKGKIFYLTKGIVKLLLQSLGLFYNSSLNLKFLPPKKKNFYPEYIFERSKVVQILINNEEVGFLGEIKPQVLDSFDIRKIKIGGFILNLDIVLKYASNCRYYKPISKFPPSKFDLAIIVDREIYESEIRKLIVDITGKLLFSIKLFDLYTGKQIPSDKKSLAYRITLQSPDHTLNETEVEKVRNKIINQLEKKFKAKIRGSV